MAVITEEAVALSLDGRLLELIILPTRSAIFVAHTVTKTSPSEG